MRPLRRTTEEIELLARAASVLPHGSLGNLRLPDEVAFVVREGRGSHVWDVSGNEYIDYLLGSGPMVLGHANPTVLDAVEEALRKGTTYFTQNRYAIELAEEIVKAVPCAEQIRFTTSGTEATFLALRLARVKRKRDKILKFEGGFHGTHDYAMMSVTPSTPAPFPTPSPSAAGIPESVKAGVLVAPFNDLDMAADIIDRHHNELAAVIVEPIQRILPPAPGFLKGLREVTAKYEIPLVFDEVVTGFRLAYGGAQEFYGVVPDLVALGKIVGGGFPLAAVAGRRELMVALDPTAVSPEDFVWQIGTLNGSPVASAAGLATLRELRAPGRYAEYRRNGAELKAALQVVFDDAEIPAQVTGDDVLFDVYFTDKPVRDYRATLSTRSDLNRAFDRALLETGVLKSAGKIYVGMCHTRVDIEATKKAFEVAANAISQHP